MASTAQAQAVIFTAPQGWGKSRHANTLKEAFDVDQVVDEWSPAMGVTPGALHLTNITPTDLADWRKATDDETVVLDAGWFYSAEDYFGPAGAFGVPSAATA